MDVKFKEGRQYHITHPNGYWSGHVKVLGVEEDGTARIVVTKFVHASKGVRDFFAAFGEAGCTVASIDWKQKEIHMTLENK